MPKLSIIVTAYNIEAYIRESLSCVLNQTLRDIEVIVVDDGSTDSTPSIISEFAKRDSRILPILFEENSIGGVATAANVGIDAATGDFIGFADGDDLYDPTMFEKLYSAAVNHSADLAMCNYRLLDAKTGQTHEPADSTRWQGYAEEKSYDLDDIIRRDLLKFVSVPWRKIYRRDLVERINLRFPVGDYFYEDNPFHWASILGGQRIAMVPEQLCQHRVARAGQTMSTVDSRLLRIFYHHDNIRDWLSLNGLDVAYRQDLLAWTANQLSWVSKRTNDHLQKELFDMLCPIVDQYSNEDLEIFGINNGRGRTYRMMESLQRKDFSAFRDNVMLGAAVASQDSKIETRFARNGKIISRGIYHLRHSGIRETAHMTVRYAKERLGANSNFLAPKEVQKNSTYKNQISNNDLMASLIILQHEVNRLRTEVSSLRAEAFYKDKVEDLN